MIVHSIHPGGARRVGVLYVALALGLLSAAAHAAEFLIQTATEPVCTFTEDGDLVVEDGEFVYGHEQTLDQDNNVQEFLVRASDGEIVARINPQDGNTYIRGNLYENVENLAQTANEAEFVIRSGTDVVAIIDDEGNLSLAGSVDPPVCIHHGLPNNGWLENDASLPDTGTGYYHFLGTDDPDTDDWGGVCWIHEKIRLPGDEWDRTPRIGINDLSIEGGGTFAPHTSHQNGRDMDLRYVRSDDLETGYAFPNSGFDADETEELVDLLVDLGAVVIYLDSRTGISESDVVTHATGHHDHMHVRFADPDGTDN